MSEMNLIIFPYLNSYDMESLNISFKICGKLNFCFLFESNLYLFLCYDDIIEASLFSHLKPAFQKCLL